MRITLARKRDKRYEYKRKNIPNYVLPFSPSTYLTLCISSPIRVNKTQNIKLKTDIADRERERIGIFPRHNSTSPLPPLVRIIRRPIESQCIENISRPTFIRRSRDHKPNIVSPRAFQSNYTIDGGHRYVKTHRGNTRGKCWKGKGCARKFIPARIEKEREKHPIHGSIQDPSLRSWVAAIAAMIGQSDSSKGG